MENEPEVIRQEMQDTRNSLAEKLEALEQQVLETVQTATHAVTDTVESVKGAVDSTVSTVKETLGGTVDTVKSSIDETVGSVKATFDVPTQVSQHPWLFVGGAVAAGFVAGRLLPLSSGGPSFSQLSHESAYTPTAAPSTRFAGEDWTSEQPTTRQDEGRFENMASSTGRSSSASASSSFNGTAAAAGTLAAGAGSLVKMFEPEIAKLKGVAIGAIFNVIKGLARQWVPPSMEGQVEEVLDNVTEKVGGKPLRGSIMDEYKKVFQHEGQEGQHE